MIRWISANAALRSALGSKGVVRSGVRTGARPGCRYRSGVDVQGAQIGLLRAHVLGRADQLARFGEHGFLGEPGRGRLGDPKSITLARVLPSWSITSTLEGFEVAVDDPLLVRVLHRLQTG